MAAASESGKRIFTLPWKTEEKEKRHFVNLRFERFPASPGSSATVDSHDVCRRSRRVELLAHTHTHTQTVTHLLTQSLPIMAAGKLRRYVSVSARSRHSLNKQSRYLVTARENSRWPRRSHIDSVIIRRCTMGTSSMRQVLPPVIRQSCFT